MDTEVVTTQAAFAETAADAPPGARVPVEHRVHVEDPFLAYRRAREDGHGAYLATTGGQQGWGYFGIDPEAVHEVGPGGTALDELGALVAGESLRRGDCTVPYPCGLVGWLSYDVARELEALPDSARRDRDLPRLQLARYGTLAAWEEPRDGRTMLRITSCPRVERPADSEAVADAYERGRRRARALAERAREGDPSVDETPAQTAHAQFESDCGEAAFTDRVRRVKEYVRDGDTFQANISQRLRAPAAVHPVEAFDALRAVNPAPYSALLEFPGVDLVSASPELLLAREGNRVVTEPIAGTRSRGETAAEDEGLERDLLTNTKERAEHAMLVDLERNDLGKVCRFGSVDVTEYRRVDRYSEVMHLVSLVEGRLQAGQDIGDLVGAMFPGGTITGAPKPRTMEIIDEVEATRRGPYTGSIAILGFDERATLNIIIRTLVRYGAEYHLRVGAGIVHDSVPAREYAETLDKGRALVAAVDRALGDRADLRVQTPR
jgi:anthranilate synthase component 1